MTDSIDKACALEQQEREYLLNAHCPVEETPNELDGHRYCIDCGIELTLKRLQAAPKAVRCVPCQEAHEHKQKQYIQRRL